MPSATSWSISARRVVGDVAHDHVEAVVDDGVALGLGVPRVEAGAQALALRLDREVDDARRPAERRRARPRLERVLGERAAERQLHVRVDVDRARDDVPARRVDGLVGRRPAPRQAASRSARCVSPSTRTSASYEPSAVTIVPLAIRVRMLPPRAGPASTGRCGPRGGHRSEAAGAAERVVRLAAPPRIVGVAAACVLTFSGTRCPAGAGVFAGLVDAAVPPEVMRAAATPRCGRLSAG